MEKGAARETDGERPDAEPARAGLVDGFGRCVTYLRVSITDRCNLRCVYCQPPEGIDWAPYREILRYEEILEIVEILASLGIRKVRVTGGEPLARRGVLGFLARLGRVPGLEDLVLTTNGVLLRGQVGALKEAGVTRLNVSLDSLDRETFARITRHDALGDVLASLEELEAHGLTPIKVNVVLIRGFNDSEILDFARLTLDRAYHVRFIEFMPMDAGGFWSPDRVVPSREVEETIAACHAVKPVASGPHAPAARSIRIERGKGVLSFVSPMSDAFCDECNRIRLTARGELRTCLASPANLDLRALLRSGAGRERIVEALRGALMEKPEKHGMSREGYAAALGSMASVGG